MRKDKKTSIRKSRKGMTLVEVLVSIAVFAIISLALVTSYIGLMNMVSLQDQYVRLEMVCNDINFYWDKYGFKWDDNYFGSDIDMGDKTQHHYGYLKYENDVIVATTNNKDPYTVEFWYDNDELHISIYTKDRDFVTNLNCKTR